MLGRIIIEGIGLSVILFIVCAIGIKDGAVGMVHVPATVLFLIFFFALTVTQIRAFAKGLTPLPRWAWVFSVLSGLLAAVILKAPNLPLTNALATGWISIGNLWMFGGLLLITKRE